MAEHLLIPDPLKGELLKLVNENIDLDALTLVDRFRSSVCHRFFPGERVSLKSIKRNGKSIEGVVIGTSSCLLKVKDSTPSKMKNKDHGSPSRSNNLLVTYDIKVDNQNEIISSVPEGDLVRCIESPREDALLQFVHTERARLASAKSLVKYSSAGNPRKPVSAIVPVSSGALPHKRKLDMDCVVSLPKLFSSMPSSKVKTLQLQLVKLDAPLHKEITTNNGKKLKQMTLFEMASKMTSKNSVKKDAPSRSATKETVLQPKKIVASVVNSFSNPKPIPEPKPFRVPLGFPSDAIGDSLSVVEFVICHQEFLRPEKLLSLSLGHFMAALVAGPDGFFYLNHMLVSFLRILVNDDSKKYEVFKVNLSSLPVSIYSASELTRLFLKTCSSADTKMVSDIIAKLNMEEFYELSITEKVNVFVVLCNKVLDTSALAKYKAKTAAVYTALLRQIIAASKENVNNVANDNVPFDEPQLSTKEFYGMEKGADNESREENDCILVVRNQRLEALKVAKAKKIEIKKEQELIMQTRQKETINKKFKDARRTLERLHRICPLGTDRNQSLYWLVIEASCCLLVERFRQAPNLPDVDRPTSQWFCYETVEQVNSLVSSMSNQFSNEHLLSKKLKFHRKVISEAFQQSTTFSDTKTKVCNGVTELEDAIYEEMIKIERDVLKVVMEFSSFRNDWLDRIEKARTCSDFAACLLELRSHVPVNAIDETDGDALEKWKVEVEECCVFSKLYVLVHVFQSFIKWDRLPKHAMCGVCNKRNQRSLVVICKRCKTTFHVNCLNPPLSELPESGRFICPECMETSGDEEDDDEEEDGVRPNSQKSKSLVCCKSIAKSKGDVVSCHACHGVYHKKCHIPPLRNTPRGEWVCSSCASKKSRRGTQRHYS